MLKSWTSVAVPNAPRLRTMVCACSKVEPLPVLTVSVADPAASAMLSLFVVNVSNGTASSSVTVTVSCEPTAGAEPPVPRFASMRIVSLGSSILSCTAVTVVVMDEGAVPTPAGRVRVLD